MWGTKSLGSGIHLLINNPSAYLKPPLAHTPEHEVNICISTLTCGSAGHSDIRAQISMNPSSE